MCWRKVNWWLWWRGASCADAEVGHVRIVRRSPSSPSYRSSPQPQNTAQRFFQRNRIQIIMYSALAIFILFVAHLLSDRDFSFLLVRDEESRGRRGRKTRKVDEDGRKTRMTRKE